MLELRAIVVSANAKRCQIASIASCLFELVSQYGFLSILGNFFLITQLPILRFPFVASGDETNHIIGIIGESIGHTASAHARNNNEWKNLCTNALNHHANSSYKCPASQWRP